MVFLSNLSFIYTCQSCNTCYQQCRTSACINTCNINCCNIQPTCCNIQPTCCNTTQPDCCNKTITSVLPTTATPTTTASTVTSSRETEKTTQVTQRISPTSTSKHVINVTSANIINNINLVNLKINVSENVNNIVNNNISSSSGNITSRKVPFPIPVTVRVPVPVPVPIPATTESNEVTDETTISTNVTTSSSVKNCCIIIIPCVPYGCNPYYNSCQGCKGSFGYMPKNPCNSVCQKKVTWNQDECIGNFKPCFSRSINCSSCNDDYYLHFDTYTRCHGCFF